MCWNLKSIHIQTNIIINVGGQISPEESGCSPPKRSRFRLNSTEFSLDLDKISEENVIRDNSRMLLVSGKLLK